MAACGRGVDSRLRGNDGVEAGMTMGPGMAGGKRVRDRAVRAWAWRLAGGGVDSPLRGNDGVEAGMTRWGGFDGAGGFDAVGAAAVLRPRRNAHS